MAFSGQRTVQVGTVETNVAEVGNGPPIVFLHGNPDTHEVWSDVVARLADRFRCIAPDLPGFGASRVPDDFDCSFENQAAWLRGLHDALELPRAHLVIHDVGGPYGLAFATTSADRVASLTICNTTFFPDYRWHFWARMWRTRIVGELAMAIANRPLFIRELRRGSPRMPKDYASRAFAAFDRKTRRMVLRWYRYMDPDRFAGWSDRMLVATEQLPKQVLWGDLDPFIPASTAERFGGTIHHFADCGHWLMVEDPDRIAREIAALAQRH